MLSRERQASPFNEVIERFDYWVGKTAFLDPPLEDWEIIKMEIEKLREDVAYARELARRILSVTETKRSNVSSR